MGDCICVRRGDGPEGCGICNETGTTPDIAGLCERQLVTITHKLPEVAFLAENARYFETRPTGGEDAAHWSNVYNAKNCRQAADTLERQAAENKRLRVALERIADPRNIHFAGDAQVVARAALTGEDTASSPTSQNTEPGLAFSDAGEP
jgi:hypothetical protein